MTGSREYHTIVLMICHRILQLAEQRPEVWEIEDPWGLLPLGLIVSDLSPSLCQVSMAWGRAKAIHAKGG